MPLVVQNPPANAGDARDVGSIPGSGRFPGSSGGKESTCNVGDLNLIPGLGRSPGEGNGYSLRYSGLENFMGCIAPGVIKSGTRLSNFHFHM